tara:strand:- start:2867 stop:3880 length:1014 start_codon:yes stop_codon:yes gene_type:complete
MKTRIGINGFGRIGRLVLRAVTTEKYDDLEIVAINSLGEPENNARMLKYDSTYGTFSDSVEWDDENLYVGEHKIRSLIEQDPKNLKWGSQGVDIVLECTGRFTSAEAAQAHIDNGAKKVIISAPAKDEDITVVLGVNEDLYDPSTHNIVSNASCTTNCVAPLIKVLHDNFKVSQGMMTTIHSYTNDQQILDKRHKDPRRARAAALNIIPTTTGAARAVGKVIPDLHGKIDGMAFRVPTASVSVTDFVASLESPADEKTINQAYQSAADGVLSGILDFSNEPLVSTDYKGNKSSCVIDGLSTLSINNNLVKVVGWYDNEWGYSCRTIELAKYIASKGL